MVVHIESCKNVTELKKHPEQLILLHWETDPDKKFDIKIMVDISNEAGVLANIIQSIATVNGNIEDLYMHRTNKVDQVLILLLSVVNVKHLEKIMYRVGKIKAVNKVTRMRS
jgi:(p)ppGpp synthase/HD superfamily hydrolase